ncbi:phage/plasmid primase, P4 family [Brevundimonas sp. DC300-4]|uniref:phage/plasmid primase, P4 family n=1 Tax=Brevundimonas sp. DC300-4 TaxID=2804594 RepID=UPI003CF25487
MDRFMEQRHPEFRRADHGRSTGQPSSAVLTAASLSPRDVAVALGGKESAQGWINFSSPGHSSMDASAGILLTEDHPEGFRLKCHSDGDDEDEVRAWVREQLSLPEPGVYVYETADGEPYLRVTKWPSKAIWQNYWTGEKWEKRKPSGPKVPYRLPELLAAPQDAVVYVTEGEKDADNVAALGLIATTNSEGASPGKWTAELAPHFAGRRVCILTDNDQIGRDHGERVAHSLSGIAAEIRVVGFPELAPKADVSDWLAADPDHDADALAARALAAPVWVPGPQTPANDRQPQQRRRGRGDDDVQITEDEAAEIFARQMSERIRFVHPIGPHLWDGHRWRAEDMNQSLDLARHHNRDLAADMGADGARYRSVSFARAVLAFAAADPALALTAAQMNPDPMMLGTPGGTVDLRTGLLHDANPDDFITRATTVAPAEKADCPRWHQFLNEAMCDDAEMVAFLRRMAGYMLTGETREHALFFAHGPGKNGKSTFVETLQGLMGDYATPAPMSSFTAKKFESHPTELADLNGARLVTASETEEGQQWAEARIKQVTGGDAIKARFMRQDFFSFSPVFKLLIMGNVAPVLNTVDAAIKRRFNFIPFAYTPPDNRKDPYLRDKLEAEWPGILRWAIEGCLEWQQVGLSPPAGVVAATESYFADQDVFSQWLEDECELEPTRERGARAQTFELSKVLFASWVAFSDDTGGAAPNTRTFGDAMKRHGLVPTKRGRGDRCWEGIALKPDAKRAAQRAMGHGSGGSF